MPAGISEFNPPPLFKFSTTPQQIGTFEGHPMYLQVVTTTITTDGGRIQAVFDITGKTLVEVNGMLRCDAATTMGWVQYPFMNSYTGSNFGSLWCDTQYLRVILGTSSYTQVKGQTLILLITYYTN